MGNDKRVALGMSGGVDSSVAVAVLQQEGYEVVGVTCVFCEGEPAEAAVRDARAVCERFGIEHAVRRCEESFERCVVAPFVESYAAGLTPSPCVGCNAQVKIPELLAAADVLGCGKVATGHYARVACMAESGRFAVLAALDNRKDQSYMLSQLSQTQLARLVLPLGGLTKLAVRETARELGLSVAEKAESQDICFAPQGYRVLLAERGVSTEPGAIILDGQQVGVHTGLADYTVGQRKGVGVAGPEPYYVLEKHVAENELVIGTAGQSRISGVLLHKPNWQAVSAPCAPMEAMVKLRYRSAACPCIIEPEDDDRVRVRLLSPQPATAPGQHAVFYLGSTVLGGGEIEEVCS